MGNLTPTVRDLTAPSGIILEQIGSWLHSLSGAGADSRGLVVLVISLDAVHGHKFWSSVSSKANCGSRKRAMLVGGKVVVRDDGTLGPTSYDLDDIEERESPLTDEDATSSLVSYGAHDAEGHFGKKGRMFMVQPTDDDFAVIVHTFLAIRVLGLLQAIYVVGQVGDALGLLQSAHAHIESKSAGDGNTVLSDLRPGDEDKLPYGHCNDAYQHASRNVVILLGWRTNSIVITNIFTVPKIRLPGLSELV